jgi:hypothetical protein
LSEKTEEHYETESLTERIHFSDSSVLGRILSIHKTSLAKNTCVSSIEQHKRSKKVVKVMLSEEGEEVGLSKGIAKEGYFRLSFPVDAQHERPQDNLVYRYSIICDLFFSNPSTALSLEIEFSILYHISRRIW